MANYKIRDRRFIDRVPRTKPPCGYCWMLGHMGYLTVQLVHKHECLKKNCRHLQKFESHPYWQQLENEKKRKKEAKQARKAKLYG